MHRNVTKIELHVLNKVHVLMICLGLLTILVTGFADGLAAAESGKLKSESFDHDPKWHGQNNRSANEREPVTVRQDFGWSETSHAGAAPGEIGGFISSAGEAAYYAASISPKTFDDELTASGTMWAGPGGTHLMLGFFNSDTAKEWRTNNSIALRINARGDDLFFAYVEYCTSRWRAGGDTTPFPTIAEPKDGQWNLLGFPTRRKCAWTLRYDPNGNGGNGTVTATIDDKTAVCNLGEGHRADGATFNRFGILNIVKSANGGSEFYVDDVTLMGSKTETFDRNPNWDAKNNRATYPSRLVRALFDFGYSADTNFADGKNKGELGGQIFRGDCRDPGRMACYGDDVGPLKLDKSLHASGKIALMRGVSDSTTLFGFYNSMDSMRVNDSQNSSIPASVVGIHVEGPSSEGFQFYPVWRMREGDGDYARSRDLPHIYPDGTSHDWRLDYDPEAAGGRGQITVKLDDKSTTIDLPEGVKASGTTFDRFGIVTSWIDGNSQDVYLDDLTYMEDQ